MNNAEILKWTYEDIISDKSKASYMLTVLLEGLERIHCAAQEVEQEIKPYKLENEGLDTMLDELFTEIETVRERLFNIHDYVRDTKLLSTLRTYQEIAFKQVK